MISIISTFLITRVAGRRPPDFIVGADDQAGAYLLRWYLTPWRGWYRHINEDNRTRWQRLAVWLSRCLPNVYLHKFLRSDDDRALHDHPWAWASLMLHGSYIEHTIAAGGIHQRTVRKRGSLKLCGPRAAHRVELSDTLLNGPSPCWTVFITTPILREWGFHCPRAGWKHWRDFTASKDGRRGEIGKGCDA
jgi:hypothetical protein